MYVVDIALPRPLDHFFTYIVPEEHLQNTKQGRWVKVPFGRGSSFGFVVSEPRIFDSSKDSLDVSKLKPIQKMSDDLTSIPDHVLSLCRWAADYYQCSLGEMLSMAIPLSAIEKEVKSRIQDTHPGEMRKLTLNDEQEQALKTIRSHLNDVILLQGVTGSGKTEVYIERAKEVLKEGRGVIFLVPEIALTPQLEERIRQGLGQPIAVIHSALSDGQRREYWLKLKQGELRVAVGARSALFAPIANCGLIVVDEEHDSSYKQEERARYHARDLAIVRGKQEKAQVILGSATPSMETLERVREGRFQFAQLKQRIVNRELPQMKLVDLTEEGKVEVIQAPFAQSTLNAIQDTLKRGEKVMVYLNRRGFASFLTCEDCGAVKECPNCSISLTFHKKQGQLRCHTCDHVERAPDACHECRGDKLLPVGAGTESLEEQLPLLIPEMKALRLDRDQITSNTRLKQVLEDFRNGDYNTLMGTQMLVKGHDFSDVTLVVVVLADSLFRWPDFRSNERAYQILVQVAGRAGRGEKLGEVLIQTYDVEHPVLQAVTGKITEEAFYQEERELRQMLSYPPFSRLLRLRLENESKTVLDREARQLSHALTGYDLLGPSEPVIERVRGLHRLDFTLKSLKIQDIHLCALKAKKMTSSFNSTLLVDVDPYGVS